MKGWLLDTNVISDVGGARPDPKVVQWIDSQPENKLFLSVLVLAEYTKGIHYLQPGDSNRPRLLRSVTALESRFSGRIFSVSDAIVFRWGAISGEVKRLTGHPPSVVDTLMAATAIEHGLYLVTRNVVHVAHSGAIVFNPWRDNPALFPL